MMEVWCRGGQVVSVGSYLMALGGRDPSGQLTTQVTSHDDM